MSLDVEFASPEVECVFTGHGERRGNNEIGTPAIEFRCELLRKKFPVRDHRLRQIFMTDELHVVVGKRGIAEHVIEMHMRIDDVTNRYVGGFGNCRAQGTTGFERTTGINYSDAFFPDDEADVCTVATRRIVEVRMSTAVDEHAIGNYRHGQGYTPGL